MSHAVPRPGKTSPGTPNVPDFKMQPKPKITTTITITIIGVIVLISVITERPRCRVG